MFKMSKVFDCGDMPSSVRDVFFERMREYGNGVSNDCYVPWTVSQSVVWDDALGAVENEDFCEVDVWLLSNGAVADESVLIEHSW